MPFVPHTARHGGSVRAALAVAITLGLFPGAAFAYVGPGAGLTAIGTLVALFAAVILAVVGFVWYPVKRMLRARGSKAGTSPVEGVEDH